jgi:hypothetical protein
MIQRQCICCATAYEIANSTPKKDLLKQIYCPQCRPLPAPKTAMAESGPRDPRKTDNEYHGGYTE